MANATFSQAQKLHKERTLCIKLYWQRLIYHLHQYAKIYRPDVAQQSLKNVWVFLHFWFLNSKQGFVWWNPNNEETTFCLHDYYYQNGFVYFTVHKLEGNSIIIHDHFSLFTWFIAVYCHCTFCMTSNNFFLIYPI